jgi:hypothetical protein
MDPGLRRGDERMKKQRNIFMEMMHLGGCFKPKIFTDKKKKESKGAARKKIRPQDVQKVRGG